MTRITSLADLRIEPVFRMEPPGMFDDEAPYPSDRQEVQDRFRRSVAGTALARVPFVPGSEILLRTRDLESVVDDLARIRSSDVGNVAEAELAGGYAFLEGESYVFGVEDSSTLLDTAAWDDAPAALTKTGKARVRHSCDHFIAMKLEKDTIVLTDEQRAKQYLASFDRFTAGIQSASAALRVFAEAFVPEYERHLARRLPPDKARMAAFDAFSNRSDWIAAFG
jgi:hypothetical protein